MCGIAGFKNNKSLNHTYNINYALSSLKHRGPDEAGYFKNKFYFNKYETINSRQKNGQQPFIENPNYCLIYNGRFIILKN